MRGKPNKGKRAATGDKGVQTVKAPKRSVVPSSAQGSFWKGHTLADLIAEQGVPPLKDPATLVADFWPEGESVDDFVAFIRAVRREGGQKEGS